MLKDGIISASNHLGDHKGEVDALNVFPVPDGDTGTNMSMTVAAAAREVALLGEDSDFGEAADRVASAMLRGARGNSGVILSLIFRGFARSVKGSQHINGAELANALHLGSEAAYKAVMKPTEGTILTVVREAAQKAKEAARHKADDAVAVWTEALQGARDALLRTPSILPVLRQAGVVDAGGQGFVYVMEGLLQGFTGKAITHNAPPVILEPSTRSRSAAALSDAEIKFTYCTEFLVEKTADAAKTDTDELRQALGERGDCVVVVDDDEIIKVHVHNNQPGAILNLAQEYGQFIQMKVENMRRQHEEAAWVQDTGSGAQEADACEPQKKYGMVAVATGEGIEKVFTEIGVDAIVRGGQSMNPSTEDILQAINQVPAEHVFVLPNNKNIIMAAEQAAPLTNRGVSVVHTRSIVEGIGAVLEFDESASMETNHVQMQRAAERVQTGLVTYAARESNLEGLDIRKGAIIGIENGKLTVTENEPVTAAYRVARHLVRRHNGSMITIYAGEDVSGAQTNQLVDMLEKRYNGSIEIAAIPGGQPMYYFMIAVE
jgi:DAK2 domain fusion protein YloV